MVGLLIMTGDPQVLLQRPSYDLTGSMGSWRTQGYNGTVGSIGF